MKGQNDFNIVLLSTYNNMVLAIYSFIFQMTNNPLNKYASSLWEFSSLYTNFTIITWLDRFLHTTQNPTSKFKLLEKWLKIIVAWNKERQ